MAVERPGVARAGFRNKESEGRVCDYIDPWRRSAQAFPENSHVFTTVFRKAAQAVGELEIRRAQRYGFIFSRPRWTGNNPGSGVGALRTKDLLRQSSVSAEQDGTSHTLQQRALLLGNQVSAQKKNVAAMVTRFRRETLAAGANQFVELALQVLIIRRRLFVQNYHINRQLLQTPVFVRPQQLPDNAHILRLINAGKHDGKIPGNPVRPQRWKIKRTAAQHIARWAKRRIRINQGIG
jgi:hypothetical protein